MRTLRNKITILLCFSALACVFSSCEKQLTIDSPTGVSDDQWWNTESDAYSALNTVYAGIPSGTKGRNVMYLSAMSDEAVHRGDFKGSYDSYTRGLANSTWNVGTNIWRDDYIDIRRANRFLENIDRNYMDNALRERMKLEVRALRAYYHLELLLFFGDIPLVTKVINPDENFLARTPASEVYDFIVSELTICANGLPRAKDYVNADIWRMSSGTCWALLSRLGLYFHDYELAKTAAKNIIDAGDYQLWKNNTNMERSYSELFSYAGELNNERIFFSRDGASNAWTTFAPAGIGGEAYVSPTNLVINNYETRQGKTIQELGTDSLNIYKRNPLYHNNRDPRMKASVFVPGENFQNQYILDPFNNPSDRIGETKSTSTGYWIKKYIDSRDQQSKNGSLDFMIIRYAEILLNYAEALIENNEWQHPDVIKYINEVRNRAAMPNVNLAVYNSQSKMRELIRRERQAELAFEGQR